jgi:hypothetical protein
MINMRRGLLLRSAVVVGLGTIALAQPRTARADAPAQCNEYCWTDCSPYGASGCAGTGCSGKYNCSTWGTCASVGLITIDCY